MKYLFALLFSISLVACSSNDKPVTEEEKEDFESLEEIKRRDSIKSDSMLKAMQQQMNEVSDDSLVNDMPN